MQCQIRLRVEVVYEEDQRCRRLQADVDVLNEGSKVRDKRGPLAATSARTGG